MSSVIRSSAQSAIPGVAAINAVNWSIRIGTSSPLARSNGKAQVIRAWNLPRPALLVGDGATDREARPAVDAFAAAFSQRLISAS